MIIITTNMSPENRNSAMEDYLVITKQCLRAHINVSIYVLLVILLYDRLKFNLYQTRPRSLN